MPDLFVAKQTQKSVTQKKHGGRFSKFLTQYTESTRRISFKQKGNNHFYCRACDQDLGLQKLGEKAIKDHIDGKANVAIANKNLPIWSFVKRKTVNEEKRALTAELVMDIYSGRHNFSMSSADCTSGLLSRVFEGCPSAENFASARTKTTAIINEEDLTENLEKCVPVMIQRWCPSTLEVMPVFEVHLPLDTPEPSKVLRTLIAKHADLPVERIEISDAFPNIGWMKWPYSKSVLELFDSVKFRGEGALHAHLENGYNGKLVYYKDSNEFKRDISEDERKSIRIKENVGSLSYNQSSNLARRKERPLRIQMSSVSESDP